MIDPEEVSQELLLCERVQAWRLAAPSAGVIARFRSRGDALQARRFEQGRTFACEGLDLDQHLDLCGGENAGSGLVKRREWKMR